MEAIDPMKLKKLMALWLEHEFWIQAGCPDSQEHKIRFPGYSALAEQDVRGYDVYRHALLPYFAEAQGFSGIHDSLTKLVDDAKARDAELLNKFLTLYDDPGERFRAQWGNLFDTIFRDELSHQAFLDYQKKFELELPLCFLAQLREIVTRGTLDINLNRFRDHSGKLKKGVVAQYIIDGLVSYPVLHSAVELGYRPKLRNAISHNSYVVENGVFRALDQDVRLTKEEFSRCFDALQTVQNAVVWFLMSRHTHQTNLDTQGVLALGWEVNSYSAVEYPQVLIYQLAPFHRLDTKCKWLSVVKVTIKGNSLITELSGSHPVRGVYLKELTKVVNLIKAMGKLHCIIVPVMPCLHNHEAINFMDGDYCQVLEEQELMVPARVVT